MAEPLMMAVPLMVYSNVTLKSVRGLSNASRCAILSGDGLDLRDLL